MEYIDFQSIENNKLRADFLDELKLSQNSQLIRLFQILSTKKNKIKINFNKCKYENVYMIMISCYMDHILIQLAKSDKFPRGFPILWIPGKLIKLFGFYPKFDNDDRQNPDNESEFDDITNIQFFKKWSGFLGQVCVFNINKKLCWTCCSKNSARCDSSFVKGCHRLFNNILNETNIQILLDHNMHLCAEIMSFDDQNHGARVLIETPIVTSVGKGSKIYLDGSSSNIMSTNFVDFLSNEELVTFCNTNGIPCDSAVIIVGNNAKSFMQKISANRDFMTDNKLEELLANNQDNITLISGNVKHIDVLGNTLEGIVVKASNSSGKQITKKYKFPKYTVRTMCLRDRILKEGQRSLINRRTYEFFKEYIRRWCVTNDGKEFWYNFITSCALLLKTQNHPELDNNVGVHIQLGDYVEDLIENKLPPPSTIFNDYQEKYIQELNTSVKSTVIISVGPIGSGKSSTSQKITDYINSNIDLAKCVHIDGDILDIEDGQDNVLKLKGERNDYTIWLIIKTIMQGNIPILSTGGGVLFSYGRKKTLILRQRIAKVLGIDIKIILLIPDNNVIDIVDYDSEIYNIKNSYNNNIQLVKDTVIKRVKNGQWKIPNNFFPKRDDITIEEMRNNSNITTKAAKNFANMISSLSKKNFIFAELLIEEADHVMIHPQFTLDNYKELKDKILNYDVLLKKIVFPRDIPLYGKFMQHRLLVKKPDETFHHITIEFDPDRNIQLGLEDFQKITSLIGNGIKEADHVTLVSDDESKCEFIIVVYVNG